MEGQKNILGAIIRNEKAKAIRMRRDLTRQRIKLGQQTVMQIPIE